jgi:hypothetical protein
VLVLATNLKGEVSTAPLEGVTTVIADTGIVETARASIAKRRVFMDIPQIRMASTRDGIRDCGLLHDSRDMRNATVMVQRNE